MSEEWRIIADFPDYAVSNEGRVKRVVPDRHGRISNLPLKPPVGNHGYEVVSLHRETVQKIKTVHRLVCEAFHGPLPARGWHASHNDGDRLNNRACNLRWASPSENNLDKHSHGTMRTGDNHPARADGSFLPRGSSHKCAKLTEAAAVQIRSDNRSQRIIAAEYGVTQSLISMVKSRKIWAHIGEQP